jgi:hypothetical protein
VKINVKTRCVEIQLTALLEKVGPEKEARQLTAELHLERNAKLTEVRGY